MKRPKRPSDEDIRNEENEAGCDAAEGENKFPAMSYADGVSAALRWVMGDDADRPYTEAP